MVENAGVASSAQERSRGSMVSRVAWAAAAAAAISALLASLATGFFAVLLLQRAEDRRLQEAVVVLAGEISEVAPTPLNVQAVVRDESEETKHTGILFAVLDRDGRRIAGDARAALPVGQGCATIAQGSLRLCWAGSTHGLTAAAAGAHTVPTSILALAALAATCLAGLAAWAFSRPVSKAVLAPLARLRSKLSELDIDSGVAADLGEMEQLVEVDQLRQTVAQLLLRVNQSLEQAQRFAGNAAHELRTPLTSLRGELELLQESADLAPAAQVPIARAQRKVVELATLVERLLVLATPVEKPGEGAEVISLRDVVEDAAAALSQAGQSRVVVIEGDAVVRGDTVLLLAMVGNALANAARYGEHIRTHVEADGSLVRLTIEDNGPGIPMADRERVFEPFVCDPMAEGEHAGHGLGLALIRHIAATHGGRARFVDGHGRGACLEITLPPA